uniref:BHLH domain-containing protein n=1 Tax=Triticum urartu TaxID=4572 RepID=A0A8R7TPV3_TRIUA
MEVRAHEATGRNRGRTSGGTTAARVVERKEAERERRQHMKALCAKLASLIPKEHFANPDTMTQLGSLDEAASYIKKLKERVDELRHRRSSAQAMAATRGASGASIPVVEVRQHDVTSMHVVLVCSTQRPIMLHEVIRILEEEGADVVNANHSVAGDKIFYTINSRALSSRIGIDVSSVSERLRALV